MSQHPCTVRSAGMSIRVTIQSVAIIDLSNVPIGSFAWERPQLRPRRLGSSSG